MTRRLFMEPISAEAFAPFGQVLPPVAPGRPRRDLIEELENGRPSGRPRLSLATVEPKTLPLVAVEMERHAFSSQAFVPIDCASYLVLVAPHGSAGGPDVAGLRAFRVPGDIGINYRADTWHHPLSAFERVARFVVFTFVDGTEGDEDFVTLPAPISIEA
jgi:ureidoglycolate lyase